MSSFKQTLNDNNQFIIAIKVIKSPVSTEYQDGTAQRLITNVAHKRALIDTGASSTCISQEYADELELIPIGKTSVTTASGACDVNRYTIDFAIPVATAILQPIEKKESKQGFEHIVIGETHWAHVQHKVHSIPAIGKDRGFDVIVGMDILSKMHITLFNREIIMSF